MTFRRPTCSSSVRFIPAALLAVVLVSEPGTAVSAKPARLTFTSGTTLELHGAAGGRIAVEARQTGVSLVATFSDEASPIVVAIPPRAGVACRGSGTHAVACASQVVTRLRVFGGRGSDQITVATIDGARLRAVTAHGGGGDDVIGLAGVAVPTYITGGAGADTMTGGVGDDVLSGGSGPDVLRGGTGHDVVDYSRRRAPVEVTADDSPGDGTASPAEGDDVGSDIEEVRGGAGSDLLTATPAGTTLVGNGGDDVLTGGAGDDHLVGGRGADRMSGGPATDTADYSARTMDVSVSLDGAANDGSVGEGDEVAADVENVLGGLGPDLLAGGSGRNDLDGGPGDDVVDGGPGVDALRGGDGDDTLRARDGSADDVMCGSGADAASVDAGDRPDADCETADTTGEAMVDARFAGVGLPAGRLAFDRRGRVRVPVVCPPVETSCTGNVMLRVSGRLLSTRLYAMGGQLVRVVIQLPPSLRRPALVQAGARAADASGNQQSTRRRCRLVAGSGRIRHGRIR